MIDQVLPSTPHAAQPPQSLPPSGGGNWKIKFLQPRSYGDARQPDSLSDPRNSTPPDRSGFAPAQRRRALSSSTGSRLVYFALMTCRIGFCIQSIVTLLATNRTVYFGETPKVSRKFQPGYPGNLVPAVPELFPEHHGSPPDKMFPGKIRPAMRRNRSSTDGKPSKDGHLPPNRAHLGNYCCSPATACLSTTTSYYP